MRTRSMSEANLFELLQLRFEFEEYNRHFKSMPQHGTIDVLERFVANGYSRNRQRPNADRALEIAKTILKHKPTSQVIAG